MRPTATTSSSDLGLFSTSCLLAGVGAGFAAAALANDVRLVFVPGVDLGESLWVLGEALTQDGVVDCDMSVGLHSFLLAVVGGGGGGVPCFIVAYESTRA